MRVGSYPLHNRPVHVAIFGLHQYPYLNIRLAGLNLMVIKQADYLGIPHTYFLEIKRRLPFPEELSDRATVKVISTLTIQTLQLVLRQKSGCDRRDLYGSLCDVINCLLARHRVESRVYSGQLLHDLVCIVRALQFAAYFADVSVRCETSERKNLANLSKLQVAKLKCCHLRHRYLVVQYLHNYRLPSLNFFHQAGIYLTTFF